MDSAIGSPTFQLVWFPLSGGFGVRQRAGFPTWALLMFRHFGWPCSFRGSGAPCVEIWSAVTKGRFPRGEVPRRESAPHGVDNFLHLLKGGGGVPTPLPLSPPRPHSWSSRQAVTTHCCVGGPTRSYITRRAAGERVLWTNYRGGEGEKTHHSNGRDARYKCVRGIYFRAVTSHKKMGGVIS